MSKEKKKRQENRKTGKLFIRYKLCHLDLVYCIVNHKWECLGDDVPIFVILKEIKGLFTKNKEEKKVESGKKNNSKKKWQTFMQLVQIQTVQLTQYKVAANQIVHCKISINHQLFTRHWPIEIIIIRITSIITITVNLITNFDFAKSRWETNRGNWNLNYIFIFFFFWKDLELIPMAPSMTRQHVKQHYIFRELNRCRIVKMKINHNRIQFRFQ